MGVTALILQVPTRQVQPLAIFFAGEKIEAERGNLLKIAQFGHCDIG